MTGPVMSVQHEHQALQVNVSEMEPSLRCRNWQQFSVQQMQVFMPTSLPEVRKIFFRTGLLTVLG